MMPTVNKPTCLSLLREWLARPRLLAAKQNHLRPKTAVITHQLWVRKDLTPHQNMGNCAALDICVYTSKLCRKQTTSKLQKVDVFLDK